MAETVDRDTLAQWLVENGHAEARPGYGHVDGQTLADALLDRFEMTDKDSDEAVYPGPISLRQHCTYENKDGVEDYSFSHTAGYCGMPQPRRCGCGFCP